MSAWLKRGIQAVAGVVTPILYKSPSEEFHDKWNQVLALMAMILSKENVDAEDERHQVQESKIIDFLFRLIQLLKEEARDDPDLVHHHHHHHHHSGMRRHSPRKDTRPCFDYLLEQQLVPQLCAMGIRDSPSGMRSIACQWLCAFFQDLNPEESLPTRDIHLNISNLIEIAFKSHSIDPVVRVEVIGLVHGLFRIFRRDPKQLECFWKVHTDDQPSSISILDGVFPYLYSLERVGDLARQTVLIAANVPCPKLAQYLTSHSSFVYHLISGFIRTFTKLPKTLPDHANDDDTPQPPTGVSTRNEQLKLTMEEFHHDVRSYGQATRFITTLVMTGCFLSSDGQRRTQPTSSVLLADEITRVFHAQFLTDILLPNLFQKLNSNVCAAMVYTQMLIQHMNTCGSSSQRNPLLRHVVEFLLHDETTVFRVLIERIIQEGSEDDSLSQAALGIFATMLDLNEERITHQLVLAPRMKTTHFHQSPACHRLMSCREFIQHIVDDSSFETRPFLFQVYLGHVEEGTMLSSGGSKTDDSRQEFEAYIVDAARMTMQRTAACSQWACIQNLETEETEKTEQLNDRRPEPFQIESLDRAKKDSRHPQSCSPVPTLHHLKTTTTAKEKKNDDDDDDDDDAPPPPPPPRTTKRRLSPFIAQLWKRLGQWYVHSLESNVVVTGIVSQLAQVPDPRVQALMFDLEIEDSGVNVLRQVWQDGQTRVSKIGTLEQLAFVRTQVKQQEPDVELTLKTFLDDLTLVRLYQGLVVMEEMLMEVSSILHATVEVQKVPLRPEGHYLRRSIDPHEDKDDAHEDPNQTVMNESKEKSPAKVIIDRLVVQEHLDLEDRMDCLDPHMEDS